jgi:hypothetical protein
MMKKLLFIAVSWLLALSAQAANVLVTLPEGVEAEEYTLAITHKIYQGNDQSANNEKKFTAYVAVNGSDVYVSGLSYYFPSAYVKGTLADGKVTFASGQYVGTDQYGNEFITSYVIKEGKAEIQPFVFIYDAATRSLTFDGNCYISETTQSNGGNLYTDILSAVYTPGGVPPLQPVIVPEGLQTQSYLLNGTRLMNEKDNNGVTNLIDEPCQRPVVLGIDGDDLYIQGLVEEVPYGWVKATKDVSGNYVVPSGQYVGTWEYMNLVYDYFITSVNRNNVMEDLVLTYDATTGCFSAGQTIALTSSATKVESYYWIIGTTLEPIVEREATPAMPDFTFKAEKSPYGSTMWYYAQFFVPMIDTEGHPMVADKLSFVFYAKKNGVTTPVTFPKSKYYMLEADLTEIPFGFTDRLDIGLHDIYFEKLGDEELKQWEGLGLQSIYRGNGVEHRSEIFWGDLSEMQTVLGISDIQAAPAVKNAAVYSLSGQRLQSPRKGLNIIGGKKIFVK